MHLRVAVKLIQPEPTILHDCTYASWSNIICLIDVKTTMSATTIALAGHSMSKSIHFRYAFMQRHDRAIHKATRGTQGPPQLRVLQKPGLTCWSPCWHILLSIADRRH